MQELEARILLAAGDETDESKSTNPGGTTPGSAKGMTDLPLSQNRRLGTRQPSKESLRFNEFRESPAVDSAEFKQAFSQISDGKVTATRGFTEGEKNIIRDMVKEFDKYSEVKSDQKSLEKLLEVGRINEVKGEQARGFVWGGLPSSLFLSEGVYQKEFGRSNEDGNSLTFKHEMGHLLEESGVIPRQAAKDNTLNNINDDYNPVPELFHGASPNRLAAEDAAVFIQNLVGREQRGVVGADMDVTYARKNGGARVSNRELMEAYLKNGNFKGYEDVQVPKPSSSVKSN